MLYLLDGSNVKVEKSKYDAYGKPAIFSAGGTQLPASAVGNRFMFEGREWISQMAIYDYRHRMYQPDLGRFLQTDPMGLQTEGAKLSAEQKALFSPGGVAPEAFTSSEMNLFRYCGDDPVDKSDPLGLYGMGTGWNIAQYRTFDAAQQAAADRLEDAASHMDAGRFEQVFGKGTATRENMAKVAATMRSMVTALRDHGEKGYVANVVQHTERTTLARGAPNGKTIAVDVSHEGFYSKAFSSTQ